MAVIGHYFSGSSSGGEGKGLSESLGLRVGLIFPSFPCSDENLCLQGPLILIGGCGVFDF